MLSGKREDFLKLVAIETARMSWPGQMHPILGAGAKRAVEEYFSGRFLPHLCKIWSDNSGMSDTKYDTWHHICVKQIDSLLRKRGLVKTPQNRTSMYYNPAAVACKLLNTFMHQLMKYEKCRHLYKGLHLVFDGQVFKKLHSLRNCYASLESVDCILTKNPYTITYEQYMSVQKKLWEFIGELNQREGVEYQISSRIELNVLWANSR